MELSLSAIAWLEGLKAAQKIIRFMCMAAAPCVSRLAVKRVRMDKISEKKLSQRIQQRSPGGYGCWAGVK